MEITESKRDKKFIILSGQRNMVIKKENPVLNVTYGHFM